MDIQARGLWIWVDMLFLLIIYAYILLTAYGLGCLFLRFLNVPLTQSELNILACLIGLAVVSMGIMIIGLIGWLNTRGIVVWMGISGSIAFRELLKVAEHNGITVRIPPILSVASRFEMLFQTTVLEYIPVLLISVLLPVWDYDALLYHLEIPRQYLAAGRIYFDPEVWRSVYPFLGEMPFLIGMVFGVDPLGKLIHLTYAVILTGSVYIFSLRFLGREVALTATAILIGVPSFLSWATWVSIDYAWASFEFWSVYAICLWLTPENQMSPKWLVLAGIMSGCAASVKYLSLFTLLIVAAIVLWKSIENERLFSTKWISNLLIFGSSAGLVMGAWYIKNWLWTGNPIYPLVFGGPGWEPLENQVLNDYIQTFGVGKTWMDYLLLPFNVYAHQAKFATDSSEIIHPALWLSLFFPFASKSNKILNVILVYAALSFVIWVTTSQVIRFLLPLSALAAIMAASVIERFPSSLKHLLKFGLIGVMLLSLINQISTFNDIGLKRYLLGKRSPAQVLQSINNDFGTILYIQNNLLPTDRALFLWSGRGYYCDQRCVPDDEQSTAIRLSINSPEPQQLAQELDKMGITHLVLSAPDAEWFISYHDPRGLHQNALDYFTKIFLPACGKSIFQDKGFELFEINCN
jgi:dolichyl-phosphate-mannose-protein mannosyltransferase